MFDEKPPNSNKKLERKTGINQAEERFKTSLLAW